MDIRCHPFNLSVTKTPGSAWRISQPHLPNLVFVSVSYEGEAMEWRRVNSCCRPSEPAELMAGVPCMVCLAQKVTESQWHMAVLVSVFKGGHSCHWCCHSVPLPSLTLCLAVAEKCYTSVFKAGPREVKSRTSRVCSLNRKVKV